MDFESALDFVHFTEACDRLEIKGSKNINGVRLKGLENFMQTRRKIFLLQVIFLALCSDVAHQASDLLEFDHHRIPILFALLYFL